LENVLGRTDGVAILNGDVTVPNLGATEEEIGRWRGKIDKVMHCASSIKFDEALAEETTRANVDGTRNILDFAADIGIPEVHYVSTAYVAGDAQTFSESDTDIGQGFRNVYERTKLKAEQMVKSWKRGRHSIYRLGIVVGDSVTGWTPSYNGYYVFARRYWQIKQAIIAEPGKFVADGIVIGPDGKLTLPLYGGFSADSTLNLVPIDWGAKMLARLVEIPAAGATFHVVHDDPPKARLVTEASLRHMGIVGVRCGESRDRDAKSSSGMLQKLLDRGISQYVPYITHEARFEVLNLPRALGADYVPPPKIDEAVMAKWLDFAIRTEFGRK
jgi:nucleoside-diphosphate-sugar epimerase